MLQAGLRIKILSKFLYVEINVQPLYLENSLAVYKILGQLYFHEALENVLPLSLAFNEKKRKEKPENFEVGKIFSTSCPNYYFFISEGWYIYQDMSRTDCSELVCLAHGKLFNFIDLSFLLICLEMLVLFYWFGFLLREEDSPMCWFFCTCPLYLSLTPSYFTTLFYIILCIYIFSFLTCMFHDIFSTVCIFTCILCGFLLISGVVLFLLSPKFCQSMFHL